jgi:hypothetical protein
VHELDPIAISALPILRSRMAGRPPWVDRSPTEGPHPQALQGRSPFKHTRPPSTGPPSTGPPSTLALQAHWAPALRGPSTLGPRQAPTGPVPHPCNDIFSPARVPGGPVAQRIEQRASNAKVAGSSPAGTAMPHLIDLRPGAAARRANVEQRLWVPQNCWRSVSACESRRRQRGRRS